MLRELEGGRGPCSAVVASWLETMSRAGCERGSAQEESAARSRFQAFKGWALDIVRRYGREPEDFFACGVPCDTKITGGGRPLVHVRVDDFDEDNDEYNTVHRVARDTRGSSLAYFLLLDDRHHGDCNAIFRPDMSRTEESLKPLLAFTESDIRDRVVPHLGLNRDGEVKGWNVLSKDKVR